MDNKVIAIFFTISVFVFATAKSTYKDVSKEKADLLEQQNFQLENLPLNNEEELVDYLESDVVATDALKKLIEQRLWFELIYRGANQANLNALENPENIFPAKQHIRLKRSPKPTPGPLSWWFWSRVLGYPGDYVPKYYGAYPQYYNPMVAATNQGAGQRAVYMYPQQVQQQNGGNSTRK